MRKTIISRMMNWVIKMLLYRLVAVIFILFVTTLAALIGTPFVFPAGTVIGAFIGLLVSSKYRDVVTAECRKFRREALAVREEFGTVDETHTNSCPHCYDWINSGD